MFRSLATIVPVRWHFSLRILSIATLVAALAACHGGGPAAPDESVAASASVPVEVAAAMHRAVTANYSGTATLEAVGDAQVVAKTSGTVLKIAVEEGMRVKKGELLATLDDDTARNKLAQAVGTFKKNQAAFDKSEKGLALKITPRADFDRDKFDLETQKAVLDGAELELSFTRVVAPIAGVVAKRSVKLGNFVQINQTMFEIVDLDPLQAVLNVPERDLNTLKPGQTVRLKVDALAGKVFAGKIARIAPVVDAASGTFRATCEFEDATRTLKPGMFGRIEVAYDERHDALVVPRSALVEEDGESSVFVVEPAPAKPRDTPVKGKPGSAVAAETPKIAEPGFVAKRRIVKVGYADGDHVEIRDGVKDGERVITIGRNAVRDGTEVRVVSTDPVAGAATGAATTP